MHVLNEIEQRLSEVNVRTRIHYASYLTSLSTIEPYENRFDLSPGNLLMYTNQVVRDLSLTYYRLASIMDKDAAGEYSLSQSTIRKQCLETLNQIDSRDNLCYSRNIERTTPPKKDECK
jgi:hypothetical protein